MAEDVQDPVLRAPDPIDDDAGDMSRALAVVLVAGLACVACGEAPPPPAIQVQRNLLSVDNRTPRDWLSVEIWINRQYRVTVPKIAAGSRFTTTLDVFVAGFGQRFDVRRQRIDDLRLTAREPDGTPVERRLEQR